MRISMLVTCVTPAFAAPYYFETGSGKDVWVDVDAWVGSGSAETILVVDWNYMNGPYQTESHAFGYRWDGSATTEQQMLQAFDDAGVFSLSTGYGGGFIYDIVYDDGTDHHSHSDELGSWNLASTADPDKNWGDGWQTIEWDWNMQGIDGEYIADGQFEGINAIYYFGSYPDGETCADYPLDIPFAVPEPATLMLAVAMMGGLLATRRRRACSSVLVSSLLILGVSQSVSPVLAAEWTQFHGDATHAGSADLGPSLSTYSTPRFQVGSGLGSGFMGANSSSPVVMNGTIYAYSASGAVTAFRESDGAQLWSTPIAGASFGSWSSPSADPASNSVYIGSGEYVYRLNATTGQQVWSYHLTTMDSHGETYASVVNASPTINATDGLVYMHTYGSFGGGTRLHAINTANGTTAWAKDLTGQGQGAVAYNAAQNLLYTTVGTDGSWSSGNGGIRAFNATTGADAWLSEGSFEPLSFGGIAYNAATNQVVAGGYDFYSYAGMLTANGTTGQTISYTGDDASPSGDFTPAFGDDNLVYVTGAEFQDGPFVMAFNTLTGQEVWRSALGWGGWNQSVVYAASDGTGRDVVYCSDQYGTRYGMFDADSGALLASYAAAGGGPGALANGNLYFLSGDGQLMAFGPGVPEPATIALIGFGGLLALRRRRAS
jgi:outer membrane protein assembly factor BamB